MVGEWSSSGVNNVVTVYLKASQTFLMLDVSPVSCLKSSVHHVGSDLRQDSVSVLKCNWRRTGRGGWVKDHINFQI